MKTGMLIALVFCAGTARAGTLATIQVSAPTPTVFFGLAASGVGAVFNVSNAVDDVLYDAPTATVGMMYNMVNRPEQYTQHGPLWVSAIGWTSPYESLGYSHTDIGLAGSAIVASSPGIFSTPWGSVTLRRSSNQLFISIYDAPVPEPSTMTLVVVMVGLLVARRGERRISI